MVRAFTDEPIAADAVERILDVARRGPSAGYSQGVEFIAVTDAAGRRSLAGPPGEAREKAGQQNFIVQAPALIVICANPEMYRSRYREPDKKPVRARLSDEALWTVPYWHTDAGCAMMLILLAAVNEGIAAAFVGFDPERIPDVKRFLHIPDAYIPIGVVALGHEAPEAEQASGSAARRPRRRFDEVVHRERW